MTASQRKAIFGICKKLGMSDDDRHALVLSVTGKESTKELTDRETEDVLKELRKRLGGETVPPEKRNPKAYRPEVPGMITNRQKGKAFALLHDLKKYDETPSEISDGARMAGIIRKELKITAYEGDRLWEWVNAEAAGKLIEALKLTAKGIQLLAGAVSDPSELVRVAAYKRNLDLKNKDIEAAGFDAVKDKFFKGLAVDNPVLYKQLSEYVDKKKSELEGGDSS